MKKLLLILMLPLLFWGKLCAQTTRIPGPAEKKITDSLCNCIGRLDQSRITNAKEANDAFMECFTKNSGLLVEVAEERKVDMADGAAMHDVGADIGKDLLTQNCSGFMKLAVKMAQKEDAETTSAHGKFKRIDNKGFNYVVITGKDGRETSFLWLRQFSGSEKFMGGGAGYAGKSVKIKYLEMEVYLPQAKDYYKVKEIVELTVE